MKRAGALPLSLLLLWLLLNTIYALAAAPAPSIQVYTSRIHDVRISVDALAHTVSPGSSAMNAVASRLRRLDRVTLPDGTVMRTGNTLLADELQAGGETLAVAHQLDALDRELRMRSVTRANARQLRTLDTILATGQFHPRCMYLGCAQQWIGARITRVLAWIGSGLGSAFAGFHLLIAMVFVLLIAGLAALVIRGTLARTVISVPATDAASACALQRPTRTSASTFAAAGDYRMALRHLFLATIVDLQERGLLDPRPGLTNTEYVRALRSLLPTTDVALQQPLQELVDAFDRVWYGHVDLHAGEYAHIQDAADRVLAAAARVRAA